MAHQMGRCLVLALAVALATPLPAQLVVGPTLSGYTSYDTAPWAEAGAAPLLVIAAFVALTVRAPTKRVAEDGARRPPPVAALC